MGLLDGFAEPFDRIPDDVALAALAEHWGIRATRLTRLDTERDDTFRADDVLLKVAHPSDDPEVIAMQSAAMAHVHATDPGIPIQRVVPALSGELSVVLDGRVARVLTWIDGDIVDDQDLPVPFFTDAGRMLGRLARALSDFEHPGAIRALAWDLPRLPELRAVAAEPLHLAIIDRFEAEVLPVLETLPHQVIHNDGHPGNLIVADGALVGILDFGDAVYSARICDPAVAATYLLDDRAEADRFVAGYRDSVPLLDEELALLPMLMAARTLMRTLINQVLQRDAHSDPYGFYARNDAKLRELLKEA